MGIKKGQLRVWWIPQVPMNPYWHYVDSVKEAQLLLSALAHYDLFQLRNNIKPDYCNAGGLEVWNGDEWEDWYDENTGDGVQDDYSYKHN